MRHTTLPLLATLEPADRTFARQTLPKLPSPTSLIISKRSVKARFEEDANPKVLLAILSMETCVCACVGVGVMCKWCGCVMCWRNEKNSTEAIRNVSLRGGWEQFYQNTNRPVTYYLV